MQLQIECNQIPLQLKPCCLCKQPFELAEAIVIIYDDQGENHGEVCSRCLSKGFDWLSARCHQLNRSTNLIPLRRTQKLETTIGA